MMIICIKYNTFFYESLIIKINFSVVQGQNFIYFRLRLAWCMQALKVLNIFFKIISLGLDKYFFNKRKGENWEVFLEFLEQTDSTPIFSMTKIITSVYLLLFLLFFTLFLYVHVPIHQCERANIKRKMLKLRRGVYEMHPYQGFLRDSCSWYHP